jgi:hypothetical protein
MQVDILISKTTPCLSTLLQLRPLDRVQINSQFEIRESMMFTTGNTRHELPWWYVQRTFADGRIEVRSPSGYAAIIRHTDICDYRPGTPIEVRAMSRRGFIEHNRSQINERLSGPASEKYYSKARVLHAIISKYGHEYFVAIEGEDTSDWLAPIFPEDLPALEKLTRRTNMPVGGRNLRHAVNADGGYGKEQQKVRLQMQKFLKECLAFRGPSKAEFEKNLNLHNASCSVD